MSQIISNLQSVDLVFKKDSPISRKTFEVYTQTDVYGDNHKFLSTSKEQVNQSLSIRIFDKDLYVTLVDMNGQQSSYKYSNSDIMEVSWVIMDKKSQLLIADDIESYVKNCLHNVDYKDLGLDPAYEVSSKITIADVNSYIVGCRFDILDKINKAKKEN